MEYPYESLTFKQIYEFLGKYVKINLLTGFKTTMTASIEGYLYTIDPITKTVVLFKEKENLSHNESNNMEVEKDKNSKEEKEKSESEEENDKDQNKIVQGVEVETKTGDETNTKIETETEMETEMEIETKNQAKKNIIDNYQIIVIMKSVIQTLSIITKKKPLTEEYLEAVIPDQNIIYIEKTDSIQNLKQSLIQYLEKNKIDYTTQPEELSLKIYNEKVEIMPPYTQSCIQSENYGSKNLAIYHIKKWWNEK